MVCYFAFISLVFLSKNLSKLWLAVIECYGLLNTLHYFSQIKKIVMTILHSLQGSLVMNFTFFTFLFTLVKSDISP